MALQLPNLDPGECLDFTVDFTDLMPAGTSLVAATVELESAAPDVSPLPDVQYGSPAVLLTNTDPQPSPTPSPLRNDSVVVWLSGANMEPNSKYTFKVTAEDDHVPKRCYVRRLTIRCKLK